MSIPDCPTRPRLPIESCIQVKNEEECSTSFIKFRPDATTGIRCKWHSGSGICTDGGGECKTWAADDPHWCEEDMYPNMFDDKYESCHLMYSGDYDNCHKKCCESVELKNYCDSHCKNFGWVPFFNVEECKKNCRKDRNCD